MVTAAACSKVSLAGLGTTLSDSARAYSANEPSKRPSTSSPVRSPRTFAPTASTTPAPSTPATRGFGLVRPTVPMSRATYGSPRTMCQSYGLRAAACTRTSTSSAPSRGGSVSTNCRMSGEPNRSWTIAFMTTPSGAGGSGDRPTRSAASAGRPGVRTCMSHAGQFYVLLHGGSGASGDRRGREAPEGQPQPERELPCGDRERGKSGDRGHPVVDTEEDRDVGDEQQRGAG